MSEQMFNIANRISAKLDTYASGVRFKMVTDGTLAFSQKTMNAKGVAHISTPLVVCDRREFRQPDVLTSGGAFTATIAAAATLSSFGGCFPTCRHAVAKMAKRQFAPILSPRLCQFGGASRACRHFMWRKSRNTVAVPVPATVHFGDNFAFSANVFHTNLFWYISA
jgi:hypothetical protein